jgi:hypothetical protein
MTECVIRQAIILAMVLYASEYMYMGKRPAVNGKKQNLRISKIVVGEDGDVVIKHLNKVKTR